MRRNLFFEKETVGGVKELDFLNNSLSGFVLKREPTFYKTSEQDLLRPDFISYKFYGTEAFWWLILLINNLANVKEELVVGMTLKLPSILDVYDYYKSKRKR